MLTSFDKALIAVLPALLTWLNQKYGLRLDTSPETLTVVVGFISSILVYFIPNKASAT